MLPSHVSQQHRKPLPLLSKLLLITAVILLIVILFPPNSTTFYSTLHSTLLNPNPSTPPTIAQRVRRSEALWQRSVRQRKELFSRIRDPEAFDFFPARNIASYFATPFTIWDFFPASYNCPHEMERVGRLGDGGKWMCGMSKYQTSAQGSGRKCVVYSFGIQNETSYEEEILRRTDCDVWGYDFSVEGFPEHVEREFGERVKFRKIGISDRETSVDENGGEYWSLADLMRENGHEFVDVLKMDVEGYEFGALSQLVKDVGEGGMLPVGQLLVEIHLGSERTFGEVVRWWEELERAGLRAVWTEPNLLIVTGGGWDGMPRYAEYMFVNVRDGRNVLLRE